MTCGTDVHIYVNFGEDIYMILLPLRRFQNTSLVERVPPLIMFVLCLFLRCGRPCVVSGQTLNASDALWQSLFLLPNRRIDREVLRPMP